MSQTTQKRLSLFISHTQSDKAIADAIRDLVKSLFGDSTSVKYSSDKEGGGGVGSGDKWTDWIVKEILQANLTCVILTPASAQKPWVLWEAGAAAGVAAATRDASPCRIVPITYQVANSEMPDPFRNTQVVKGDDGPDVVKLMTELLDEFAEDKVRAGRKLDKTVETYLDVIATALAELPIPVTEASVQEWIERIKEFSLRHGAAEIDQLCDWMNTAFGYGHKKGPEPLDPRLHRRLGELYAKGGRKFAKQAAEQFELARRLAPRDIYILRNLGKAYLDQDDLGKAEAMINRIEKFDPNAFARDIEAAAFKMRWQKQKGDLNGAIKTAGKALENNFDDHYLIDNLAQLQAADKQTKEAIQTFGRLLHILEKKPASEQTLWTQASGLNAALVARNEAQQKKYLEAIIKTGPSAEAIASIKRGLASIAGTLVDANTVRSVEQRLDALHAPAPVE